MAPRVCWIWAFFATSALLGCTTATDEFGTQWLLENSKKEGVITLPSGLQYKSLRRGHGDSHPTIDSSCSCHYQGQTAKNYPDGPFFDSSYKRGSPTSFAPNQVRFQARPGISGHACGGCAPEAQPGFFRRSLVFIAPVLGACR